MSARMRLLTAVAVAAHLAACGPPAPTIRVVRATYGGNCGAPPGNATGALASSCDGRSSCVYTVDFRTLGDPVPGCAKAFDAAWRCLGQELVQRLHVREEAGLGSAITLGCGA